MKKQPQVIKPYRILLIIIMLCFRFVTVTSFLSPSNKMYRLRRHTQPSLTIVNQSKQPNTNYNDDAFGLVFLGSATLAQDPIFAGVFLVTSAAAAIACAQGKLPKSDNRIPAAVAGLSLVATPVIGHIILSFPVNELSSSLPVDLIPGNPSARWIELALCSVSIVYGLVSSTRTSDS